MSEKPSVYTPILIMKKYTIEVRIVLDLEIEEEKPSLAEDTATELVYKELKKTELGKAKYKSVHATWKNKRSER